MSCRKKKPSKKPKPGRYECKDCGVISKKKNVCTPKKIKKSAGAKE